MTPSRQRRIEVGNGLVEDQEVGLRQQRAGERQPLALTAGKQLTLRRRHPGGAPGR